MIVDRTRPSQEDGEVTQQRMYCGLPIGQASIKSSPQTFMHFIMILKRATADWRRI